MSYNYDILLKYIILGDPSTGKTSLMHRFTKNSFQKVYQPTLAVEFQHKIVQCEDFALKIMLWDTAGQQTFRSIVKTYYRNCIVAVVVYDATNRKSFQSVEGWLKEVDENCQEGVRKVIVANKVEEVENIVVRKEEAIKVADKHNAMLFEVSAATGQNVDNMLLQPAERIVKDIQTKKLVIPRDKDIGVKLSDRKPLPSASKLEIVIKGQEKSSCPC